MYTVHCTEKTTITTTTTTTSNENKICYMLDGGKNFYTHSTHNASIKKKRKKNTHKKKQTKRTNIPYIIAGKEFWNS